MTMSWLKTDSSRGLFLKGRHSIYNIETLSPNHIGQTHIQPQSQAQVSIFDLNFPFKM